MAALLLAGFCAAQNHEQARKLHQALDWMETRGDCRTALRLLHEVAQGLDRNLAARALLYSASCREKLGDAEARVLYERVTREFPDQQAVAAQARGKLGEIGTWAWRVRNGAAEIRVAKIIPLKATPYHVTLVPGRPEAYVGTATGLAVIETGRRELVHEIPLGEPVICLGATPNGDKVLAGHISGKLRIVDTATRIAVTILFQGGPVHDIQVTPDGRWAYAAALEYGIKKVDIENRAVDTTSNAHAVSLALTPNGRMLFASLKPPWAGGFPGHNVIGWFDGLSGQYANAIIGLPLVASWLSLTPDGSQLWAGAEDACSSPKFDHRGCPEVPSKAVHVISTASQKLIRTIAFALPGPGWAAPSPDGSLMALGGNQAVLLVDTKTFAIAGSLPLVSSGNPAFTRDGSIAYFPQLSRPGIAVVEFTPVVNASRGASGPMRHTSDSPLPANQPY